MDGEGIVSIKRLCLAPSCSRFRDGDSKWCSVHRPKYEAEAEKKKQEYLSMRRKTITPERQKLYGSAEYKRRRKLFLEQNPFCQYPGCNMPSTDLHHDWPVGYNYWNEQDFNDESHWVALCGEHHRQISRERMKNV